MSKKFTLVLFMLPLMTISALSLFAQNTALSFNKTNSDHATTVSASPIQQAPFTVELWAYVPTSDPSQSTYFISEGASGNQFAIGYNGFNGNHLNFGDQWFDLNEALPMGQWNHIAITFDGVINAYAYLNGVLIDSVTDGSFFVQQPGTQLQLGTDVDSTSFFTGKLDKVRIWSTVRTAAQIKAGMYGSVDPASPGLTADYEMDAAPGYNVSSASSTGYDLSFVGTSIAPVSSPISAANNGLVFDGTATMGQAASNPAYDALTTGTVEAWVKPNSTNGTIVAIRDATNSRLSVHLNNTNVDPTQHYLTIFNNQEGAAPVFYTPGFTNGVWYHVAFVTASAGAGGGPLHDTTGVYVNGAYIGVENIGYGNTVPAGLPLTFGGNLQNVSTENFNGGLDEIRIWNVARTQSEIQSTMGSSLDGGQPNLVSVYGFNQGIADGDNTGLKVVVDNAPLTNNATLNNAFSLNGVGSNFTANALVPLPLTLTQFTVTKQNSSAYLQWQTSSEENTSAFVIERSGNGSTFTDIGSVAAAGTSHSKLNYAFSDNTPLEGKNYYRLRETDLDNKFTFSPIRVLNFTSAGKLIWYSTGSKTVEIRLQNGSNELYSIADVAGHTIRKGRLSSGITSLSQLPAGMYFVKVVTNAGNELNTKVVLK